MKWLRTLGALRVLLAGSLAIQPTLVLAQDTSKVSEAAQFRSLLQEELSSIRQELHDQRQLIDFLTQQVLRGGLNRAQLEQTLSTNKAQLQSALDAAKGDIGQQLKDAVAKFNPDAVKSLTAVSPKEEVDKALGGLQQGLNDIAAIKRQTATELQEALSKTQCVKELTPSKVIAECKAKMPGLDPRLAQVMSSKSGWTSEIASRLPDACVPDCLKNLQDLRDRYRQADAAGQQAALMANTMLLMAMQTGNPYVIAAAMILAVLIAAFGGGGGSGNGNGDGDGRGKGQGRGSNRISESGSTPAQPGSGAGPGGAKVKDIDIVPGRDIEVIGGWPQITLTKGVAKVTVDFTEVYDLANQAQKLQLSKGRVKILNADPASNPAIVEIEADNPNKPGERTSFQLRGEKEGDRVVKWTADIARQR